MPSVVSVRVPSAPRGAGRGSGWGGELREVRLDDGRRFCVDAEQMARFGLAPGETVDDALAARLEARDAYLRARNAAVRLLAIRPRSIAELRLRLRRTGVPETHAGAVVRDLLEAGYLDDLSFARAWIAARLRANRRGLRGLRLELREKGVAAAIIEQAIREACGEEGSAAVEARAARAIVERRLRAYAHLGTDARCRRVAGLLERRGFSSETIAQLLRTVRSSNRREAPESDDD